MPHRNAPLTETGRLRLARCVVEDNWPLRRAAERFQVSPTTAQRWADRYRTHGEAGMSDHSSRPHTSPRRTPTRTERRIIKVRVLRRWGPARIAYRLGRDGVDPVPSHMGIYRALVRHGLIVPNERRKRLREFKRWERGRPMELWQLDVVGGVLLADKYERSLSPEDVFDGPRSWAFGATAVAIEAWR